MQCLPVRDDVLMRLLEALAQIGGGAKSRRAAEEKRAEAVRTRRQETHASHASVMGHVLAQTAGRRLTPLELSSAVNNAYLNQAKQQAALAEQAAQVERGGGRGRGEGGRVSDVEAASAWICLGLRPDVCSPEVVHFPYATSPGSTPPP